MNRVFSFLRSVIPADPWQLVLLAGVVCLYVSPFCDLWPREVLASSHSSWSDADSQGAFAVLRSWVVLLRFPLIFSGIAGYFVCFWPGDRPIRRMAFAVFLPALLSLAGIVYLFFLVSSPRSSVLYFQSNGKSFLHWLKPSFFILPTGLLLCATGLALITIFLLRAAIGVSVFRGLLQSGNLEGCNSEGWERVRTLVFVLIGPGFLLISLAEILVTGIPFAVFHVKSMALISLLAQITTIVASLCLVVIGVFVLGREKTGTLLYLFRFPPPASALVAIGLPLVVSFSTPLALYIFDRVQWAAHLYGKYSPPMPSHYFDLSKSWHLWLFLLVFAAIAEEIIFRGLLLPRFVERYGLQQGILLIGLIWAAIHFAFDSHSGSSFAEVLYQLANRVFFCVAFNYVLTWMTLRQGSIVSAVLAHWGWNMLNIVPRAGVPMFTGEREAHYLLLGVIGYLLFRFWPVTEKPPGSSEIQGAAPVPAN